VGWLAYIEGVPTDRPPRLQGRTTLPGRRLRFDSATESRMTTQVPAGSPFLSDARLQSLLDDAQPVPPPAPTTPPAVKRRPWPPTSGGCVGERGQGIGCGAGGPVAGPAAGDGPAVCVALPTPAARLHSLRQVAQAGRGCPLRSAAASAMNPSVSLWACGASPSNSFKELMRALMSAESSPTAGEALSSPLRERAAASRAWAVYAEQRGQRSDRAHDGPRARLARTRGGPRHPARLWGLDSPSNVEAAKAKDRAEPRGCARR
jgi:hypothetical protein